MQYFISTLLLAAIAIAAPEAPSNGGPYPPAGSNGGPYPPSGWKPSGRLLLLPARQVSQVPSTEYGAPSNTDADPATTDNPSTTPQSEESDAAGFNFQQLKQQPGTEHGIYHVLLPDGRLQRVEYATAPLKGSQQYNNAADQQSQDNNNNYNNYQQEQNNYQQQSQSGKYQQGQFEQQGFPQITTLSFPSTFPQPAFQQPQNSKFQVAQFSQSGNFQSSQYKQFQGGKQNEQSNYPSGYAQPQNNKYAQNKNQAQPQYPQQPEYEQGASQNQFNKKQFKQQGQNQNKQGSANTFSSETSSRFTNANAQQQQQQQPQQGEVVEYQPIYFAQQAAAQEAPAFAGYVANVQYKDVEPIPSPIYSYNPAPLVRILRKTE